MVTSFKYPVYDYQNQKWVDSKQLLMERLNTELEFYSSNKCIECGAIKAEQQIEVIEAIKQKINSIN